MKNEFDTAIKFLATEKNLDTEVVYRAIEDALASAYRKDELADKLLRVHIDRASGDIHVWSVQNIVHEIEDPYTEISLEDARAIKPGAMVGDLGPMTTTAPAGGGGHGTGSGGEAGSGNAGGRAGGLTRVCCSMRDRTDFPVACGAEPASQ